MTGSAEELALPDGAGPVFFRRHRVNGVALHTAEAGPEEGPPVILLHGFPEFWWGWRRQIGALAGAGFRVIAPDQRGYNLSSKPLERRAYGLDTLARDVIGLADLCGAEAVGLVGHDWGGLVAWWTASSYPQRIRRLAALNAPHPDVVGPYMRRHPQQMARSFYAGFFQLPWLPEAMLSANGYGALERAMTGTSRAGTFTHEDIAVYRAAWRQPGALTAMLNWYRALPLKPRLGSADKLAMPALVLWGRRDRFLESGLAEASLELCGQGRVRWFEHATHWVHLEEAQAVNRELIAFLRA